MNPFNRNQDAILIIQRNPAELHRALLEALPQASGPNNVKIFEAHDAVSGFESYRQNHPCLVLIDDDLPDMRGMSCSGILKDAVDAEDCTVYVFNIHEFIGNSKADFVFFQKKDVSNETLCLQVADYFSRRNLMTLHSIEIERAKARQLTCLPESLDTKNFKVDIVFSPFSELSGDGVDYWCGPSNTDLYGFLFDCTGHDIISFSQTGEIRSLLKRGCKYSKMNMLDYETLADVLRNVNNDLCDTYQDDVIPVAAVLFFFDFVKKTLTYVSAGIPNFFVKYKDDPELKTVPMKNYLIGYEPDVDYKQYVLKLDNIEKVIFSSDGFSDLLFNNAESLTKAKHDDVSIIIIDVK